MLNYTEFCRLPASLMLTARSKTWAVSIVRKIATKRFKSALLLALLATLAGCASGSALVTGQARPPVEDHTSISILTEMPGDAELIAIVKASSDSGWTQQGSLNYAVDELKKQAAKVGANAVVLGNRETSTHTLGVPAEDGGTFISSSEMEIVQGKAIWVD